MEHQFFLTIDSDPMGFGTCYIVMQGYLSESSYYSEVYGSRVGKMGLLYIAYV